MALDPDDVLVITVTSANPRDGRWTMSLRHKPSGVSVGPVRGIASSYRMRRSLMRELEGKVLVSGIVFLPPAANEDLETIL